MVYQDGLDRIKLKFQKYQDNPQPTSSNTNLEAFLTIHLNYVWVQSKGLSFEVKIKYNIWHR